MFNAVLTQEWDEKSLKNVTHFRHNFFLVHFSPGEPAKETVRVPSWSLRGIAHTLGKFGKQIVELRRGGGIHRLRKIVFHAVITILVPGLKDLFFGSSRQIAELEGERRYALLDETVLIAANKSIFVGFFIRLSPYALSKTNW